MNKSALVQLPDLSNRPYSLTVERLFPQSATLLYEIWTERFDLWFAAPGSVLTPHC
jgi:hypothetical protein